MNPSDFSSDQDQDSLFGSPPPSPARGRSPSPQTSIAGENVGPTTTVTSTAVGSKNVGTIALPGSHMSCAELPANLPASSLSLPRPSTSHDPRATSTSVHTPVAASRSSTHSLSGRASSAVGTVRFASAPTRKRKPPKAKSLTSAPPITLPGPNEPTPPNFLRSQSSLLGLAGLVGCVKPAQLYTHASQSSSAQPSRSHSPIRGLTPAHPIVLDDEQDASHVGKRPRMPQRLDQLDPETLRSNIVNSLAKEKNIFPVLESLIKILGGEPRFPSANPPHHHPFSRPYGHNVYRAQSSALGIPTAPSAPPQKRRKLKHVPAGAADWDVPFPFAAGEGPEAYQDTWAQDRAKQLVTQLLELVQCAARRAAIKTAKSAGNGWSRVQSSQSSRSVSLETQIGQTDLTQANVHESLSYISASPEGATTGTPSSVVTTDSLGYGQSLWEASDSIDHSASHSKDRMSESVDSEGAVEDGGSGVPCDYAAFEEWLSQLQQFMPLQSNTPITDSEWSARAPLSLDSSSSGPASNVLVPVQCDALTAPHVTRDEAIDPALLAISQQVGSVPQPQSSTSLTSTPILGDMPQALGDMPQALGDMPQALGDMPQALDDSLSPPVLIHSPRTSLSSLTGPLTPPPEACADITIAHQDLIRDPCTHRPLEDYLRASSLSLTERSGSPRIVAAQKGKARAVDCVATGTSSASTRSTPSVTCTSKGTLDKQAILERARERRGQLVSEIKRAKMEIWETSIENAVLVRLTRDGSS